MFFLPLDQIEFTQIENFCRTRPREGIILNFKRDFPRRLDKSIAAFANTEGGHILIGVDEDIDKTVSRQRTSKKQTPGDSFQWPL